MFSVGCRGSGWRFELRVGRCRVCRRRGLSCGGRRFAAGQCTCGTGVPENDDAAEGLILTRWKNLNTGFGPCRSRGRGCAFGRSRAAAVPSSRYLSPFPPRGVPAGLAGARPADVRGYCAANIPRISICKLCSASAITPNKTVAPTLGPVGRTRTSA